MGYATNGLDTNNTPWTAQNIPDQSGKVVLITGANSGIGYEKARVFAEKGAEVVMACRNEQKAEQAIAQLKRAYPNAKLIFLPLDLASQDSTKNAVDMFQQHFNRLDLLINNAGVMWLPRCTTQDGYEMQFGTNHLGHFTLTGLLLNTLLATPESRVVTVSSIAHKRGNIHFDDLQLEKRYGRWKAYTQSKLANLIFAYELQRRLSRISAQAISIAAHPGVSNTNLAAPGVESLGMKWVEKMTGTLMPRVTQTPANGALPSLYAATSPDVAGSDYIGPNGFLEMYGSPRKVGSTRRARNQEIAQKLWNTSVELTGVDYAALTR